jgi:hypothetical protein
MEIRKVDENLKSVFEKYGNQVDFSKIVEVLPKESNDYITDVLDTIQDMKEKTLHKKS